MSLEQAVVENTAALNNVAALLANFGKPVLQGSGAAAPAKPAKAAPAPAAVAAAPAPQAATLDYETVVNPKILETVKKAGRETAIKILAEFKNADGKPAANGKQVQPADYAELIAKCDEMIALKANATAEAPLV